MIWRAAFMILTALTTAVPAQAANWRVDPDRSTLGFEGTWSGEPFRGTFRSWTAEVEFDPNDLEHARAVVTVDVSSLTSGEDELDMGLKGHQGFEVKAYPAATFVSSGFHRLDDGSYEATGDLTIRGISREIVLIFTLEIEGSEAHMTGKAELLRTDFGLGRGEWAGTRPVAHEVTVMVEVFATKEP